MFAYYKFIDSNSFTNKDGSKGRNVYLHDEENHKVDTVYVKFPIPSFEKDDEVIVDYDFIKTKDAAFLSCKDIRKKE